MSKKSKLSKSFLTFGKLNIKNMKIKQHSIKRETKHINLFAK